MVLKEVNSLKTEISRKKSQVAQQAEIAHVVLVDVFTVCWMSYLGGTNNKQLEPEVTSGRRKMDPINQRVRSRRCMPIK